jgi:probable rRNA maturation factor
VTVGHDHLSILVSDRQSLPVDHDGLAALARDTLRAEGVGPSELSLSFVDDEEMSQLHRTYAGEEGPTDVLSFPLDRAEDGVGPDGTRLLGDVVIAPGVAARNNPEDPPAELRLLVVHGILHVLGYDHERGEERAEMWERQERYTGMRVP